MRDHEAITIEEFNGWWKRGDKEACPLDHAVDLSNVQFFESGVRTRDGIDFHEVEDGETIPSVVRLYTFVHNNVQSLLVLDSLGNIYHTGSPTPLVAILSIPEMTDFAFIGIAGRAYISPHDGVTGLQNQYLYVYMGDGTQAFLAGGAAPIGAAMTVVAAGTGNIEAGIHIFGVVYETVTGFLTQIGPDTFTQATFNGTNAADISGVPVAPSPRVVARRIVATKAINPAEFVAGGSNLEGYQFFFVPNGRIPNNSATTITVNFYDVELLEDASHLLDVLDTVPAGVLLTTYHDRMVIGGFYADPTSTDQAVIALPSTLRISAVGEPEAFDSVDGVIVTPLEGNSLTIAQEFRDILYVFKRTRTYAYADNFDVPATWKLSTIDNGIGASVHGIAFVLDSGGVNIEYLIILDYSGIMLFNGAYIRPELSWKISDYWYNLDRDIFKEFQIANDSISQRLYITQGSTRIIYADYSVNLDPKAIKWAPWDFKAKITSVALMNTTTLILGAIEA